MAAVTDNYRMRFDVAGVDQALSAFDRIGRTGKRALADATDPGAGRSNMRELERTLKQGERALAQYRTALDPLPRNLRLIDGAARNARSGVGQLIEVVPGLGRLSTALIGPAGVGAAIGLVGAAAISSMPRAVSEIAELARTAERLGVSVELLQSVEGAMLVLGERSDGLEDAFATLNERIGQAVLGLPEGVSVFEDLGIAFRNADGGARTLEDILPELADRLASMGSEAEQTALLTELFGDQGKVLARVLRDGSVAFDEQLQKARDLGLVLGEDTVRAAKDADTALATMGRQLQTFLAPTLIAGAELLTAFVGGLYSAAEAVRDFGQELGLIADRSMPGLQAKVGELWDEIGTLQERLADAPEGTTQRVLQQAIDKKLIELEQVQNAIRALEDAASRGPVAPRSAVAIAAGVSGGSSSGSSGKGGGSTFPDEIPVPRVPYGAVPVPRGRPGWLEDLEDQAESTARVVAGSIEGAFDLGEQAIQDFARTGKLDLEQFAADASAIVLNQLTRVLFDAAASGIGGIVSGSKDGGGSILGDLFGSLGGLFGGGEDAAAGGVEGWGYMAKGGRLQSGRFAIVGEEGPEIVRREDGALGVVGRDGPQVLAAGGRALEVIPLGDLAGRGLLAAPGFGGGRGGSMPAPSGPAAAIREPAAATTGGGRGMGAVPGTLTVIDRPRETPIQSASWSQNSQGGWDIQLKFMVEQTVAESFNRRSGPINEAAEARFRAKGG